MKAVAPNIKFNGLYLRVEASTGMPASSTVRGISRPSGRSSRSTASRPSATISTLSLRPMNTRRSGSAPATGRSPRWRRSGLFCSSVRAARGPVPRIILFYSCHPQYPPESLRNSRVQFLHDPRHRPSRALPEFSGPQKHLVAADAIPERSAPPRQGDRTEPRSDSEHRARSGPTGRGGGDELQRDGIRRKLGDLAKNEK